MQGLDIGAVVHYTGQYEDDNVGLTGSQSNPIKQQMPEYWGHSPSPPAKPQCRAFALARAESAGVDYAGSDRVVHVQPAAARSGAEVPGLAKDGGKNFKMKDGKEKNVMPVSTSRIQSLCDGVLVE